MSEQVPETLTLPEAHWAAFHLVDAYLGLESSPDTGLVRSL